MQPQPQAQSRAQEKEVETGTTTVGLVAEDAVILAADKRATLGRMKSSKEAEKILSIADNIALTISGSVGDAQQLVRIMRSQLKLRALEAEPLSVKGSATLLANILHAQRLYPFFNQFILGGVDDTGATLYDLDPLGSAMEASNFTATGSGSPMAYGLLEDAYEDGISVEDGKELGIRTVTTAIERDTASGDGIDVAVLTDKGITRLDADDIESYL